MNEMIIARNISLNQTSEFCRSLGEITNYGRAGNRREEEEDELLVGYQIPTMLWLGIGFTDCYNVLVYLL